MNPSGYNDAGDPIFDVTTTDAATVYVEGAPVKGENMTIVKHCDLWLDMEHGSYKYNGDEAKAIKEYVESEKARAILETYQKILREVGYVEMWPITDVIREDPVSAYYEGREGVTNYFNRLLSDEIATIRSSLEQEGGK
jgi:hypothetical protein